MQQRVSKNSECMLMVMMIFAISKPLKLIRATKMAETADNIYYSAPCAESIMLIHCTQSRYMWSLFTYRIVRVKKLCFLLV